VEHITFALSYFELNVFYLCSSLYGATVIFQTFNNGVKTVRKAAQKRSV
jgi:hypothetical protein